MVGKPLHYLASDPGLISHEGHTNKSHYLCELLGQASPSSFSVPSTVNEYHIKPGLTPGCRG